MGGEEPHGSAYKLYLVQVQTIFTQQGKFIQAMYGKKNRMSYRFNIIDACMYECYTFITLLVDICMLYMAICKTLLNRCCISLTVYESLSDCELIYVTRAELLLITTESVAVFSI
jgi:hypothetical protein